MNKRKPRPPVQNPYGLGYVFRNSFGECIPTPGAMMHMPKQIRTASYPHCIWNYLVDADLYGRCIVYPVLTKPVVQSSCTTMP